jgi:hypothetical protein
MIFWIFSSCDRILGGELTDMGIEFFLNSPDIPSVNSTFTAQEMLFQIKWAIAQYEQEGVDVSRNIRTV